MPNNNPSITYGQSQQMARNAIALAVVNNRHQLEALLQKYGVDTSKADTDEKLIIAILVAMQGNKRLRHDLKGLLVQVTPANSKNFTAESGFFFTAEKGDGFFNFNINTSGLQSAATAVNAKTTTTTTKDKTAVGSFLSGNLDKILGTGLDTISTLVTNKSNSKLADKALAIEVEKTKQAALGATIGNAAGAAKTTGMSTGAKIAIGVGVVAVLGTIVWLLVRKKK